MTTPPPPISEEDILREALERVRVKKGFYTHVAAYVLVNILLVVIWWFTTGPGSYPWFVWVIGGWGLVVVFNALGVFVFTKYGSSWERRRVEKEAARIRKSPPPS